MGKTLRIGIITAYLAEDWHSQQLVAAAKAYGDAVVIRPEHLAASLTRDGVAVITRGFSLDQMDGFVLARGFGERGNADFLVPVYQLLERSGKVLVNSINAVLTAIDKFESSCRLQQAGLPTPNVAVVQDAAMGRDVLRDWGCAVAKPLFGSLGLGIELLEDTVQGRALLPVLLERFGAVYLQEYVPRPDRDIRAFVVGDHVEASMFRRAAPGTWLTNIHQGGQAEACELDASTQALAVAAAQAVGLDYTGVDLLEGPRGPVVIEVNGNPLWRGLLQATGRNMAEAILSWVVHRITATTRKGGERHAEATPER
jgi:ribosomal protein S6--L-glutamate ligase